MAINQHLHEKISALCVSDICDHLVVKHNLYCRNLFPAIFVHLHAVEKIDSERNPAVRKLRFSLELFREEAEQHLRKEEFILFPYIRRLEMQINEVIEEQNGVEIPMIDGPVSLMKQEHRRHQSILDQLKATVGEIDTSDCSPTLHVLLDEINNLTENYLEHINIEHDILFPKALELERRMKTKKLPPSNHFAS
ncbi:MAG: hypothetical protein FD123_759 [Bacteroidetes bacterium]|nr:MAG: hypothetical protein FD123_759 [Bacteroidota bacterium]